MRTRTKLLPLVAAALIPFVSPAGAGGLDGTVKIGGIVLDEVGDKSAVQETYNIHDGFSLSQILLDGALGSRSHLRLDLREMNLDSRQGDLVYRIPGAFKLTAGYDQYRQVFDPDRATVSERKDWRLAAQLTPAGWLSLGAGLNGLDRSGDRLGFPAGTASVLGLRYDNRLITGQVNADVRKGARGGGITYRHTDYSDESAAQADRTGDVVSARVYSPCVLYKKLTHYLRGAYGVRKLSNGDLDYTLANFQYRGVVEPIAAFRLRYTFDANRIDNESTDLKTDRFRNDLDATYYYGYGNLSGGYGYETNDDDRSLTNYNSWRAGAVFDYRKLLLAKLEYASRTKKDEEELTLLKDLEASRLRVKVQTEPVGGLTLGGDYASREREFPDIGVEAEGDAMSVFGRYRYGEWGTVSVDYAYTDDEYTDLAGGFDTDCHTVTGRVDLERIRDIRLGASFTYLDIGKDLDIEKSMVSFEGAYTFRRDYHVGVKYNVYNYDDYVLLDRYYTANVVWFDFGYDFHLE